MRMKLGMAAEIFGANNMGKSSLLAGAALSLSLLIATPALAQASQGEPNAVLPTSPQIT
jgi:AAA15 family ATPase/GTPase